MFKFLEKGRLPARWRPRLVALSLAALAIAAFVQLAFEVIREPETTQLDEAILLRLAQFRRPWLNAVAMDVSALGSVSLMLLLSLVALAVLLMVRDRVGVLQLVVSVGGAEGWGQLAKSLIHRERPTVVSHLVEESGFSFPSGHSLSVAAIYLTLAFLLCRHFPRVRDRFVLFAISLFLVALVGLSRMYLGVHYASDVLSGVCLGSAWALLMAAAASFLDTEVPAPS